MAERTCEGCGNLTQVRHLGKIRGKQLCKKCRISIKEDHRKETINQSTEEEREKIRELSRKQKREWNRAYYKRKEKPIKSPPVIKGSKLARRKPKSNSYLTIEDKRQLLRILMARGLDFEEAKKELKVHIEQQRTTREEMQSKNKSEEEIRIKQKEMLEELWNY